MVHRTTTGRRLLTKTESLNISGATSALSMKCSESLETSCCWGLYSPAEGSVFNVRHYYNLRNVSFYPGHTWLWSWDFSISVQVIFNFPISCNDSVFFGRRPCLGDEQGCSLRRIFDWRGPTRRPDQVMTFYSRHRRRTYVEMSFVITGLSQGVADPIPSAHNS